MAEKNDDFEAAVDYYNNIIGALIENGVGISDSRYKDTVEKRDAARNKHEEIENTQNEPPAVVEQPAQADAGAGQTQPNDVYAEGAADG
jgi:hypothetical protein